MTMFLRALKKIAFAIIRLFQLKPVLQYVVLPGGNFIFIPSCIWIALLRLKHCISEFSIKGRGSCIAMLAATFTQVQHFECSDTIERRDGIVFDFCMRLPHTVDPHISGLDGIKPRLDMQNVRIYETIHIQWRAVQFYQKIIFG